MKKLLLFILISVLLLLLACASDRTVDSDQPIEPTFQERVAECSKIADRSERNRCLYDN